ncbi:MULTISPECIES: DNA mismatch repair endonuclease MutL [Vibrio]|uniref:DNA mismatch repair endonuclease MutL n=1 Tax=Vibrio TaxID=662 RepID=UPI0001B959EA|nr:MULTISPECIES: DNA mismatch repair endonuclease MutL [Vibrio]EEX35569.1 DNA mismatch repair protein MutL [Vibrio coralliilyticus ATCC BAA-450]MCM5511558.1 DNA mismatch repair endonuclease MutL [Vibrio sp. SCSIO 43169]MDE3900849.1 DNA mismatch repair endonuclease MutL [Vibrio sp. CC007]QFT37746.1 DNA mismatch repair protein MutL [Vibrio sp. THAF64]QGM35649.1 DNA mismatch repair protein MutL [Vibrio sp. THAF191d]
MTIKILPARLANQIAAGEVVERPASVVKELVENSLDSGATRIDIDIEKGGTKLIRVRDNGKGIAKDELGLALSRHATSKIHSLDDLEAIMSLGFRGEALASISSVARLTLTSRPATQDQAWSAYSEGREMQVKLQPTAHPIGTSVEVLDLFFNTPARRKFLRTEKTEFTHIDELLKRIALSRFDVTINLRHNGKMIKQYRAAKTQVQEEKRIAAVCGNPFVRNMLKIELEHQGLKLHGWITTPEGARQQSDLQYCYVNGRMMRDKLINHAIRQSYETSLRPEQFATYVLFIEIDPHQVDVNVHPAKHEVRFHQARLVHDFIYQALSDALVQSAQIDKPDINASAFHTEPVTPEIPTPVTADTNPVSESVYRAVEKVPAYPGQQGYEEKRQAEKERTQVREAAAKSDWVESRPVPRQKAKPEERYGEPAPSKQEVRAYKELLETPVLSQEAPPIPSELEPVTSALAEPAEAIEALGKAVCVTQGQYLLMGDKQGARVVSMAKAEWLRVNGQLSLNGGALKSQPLLVPLSLKLDHQQIEASQQHHATLMQFGIELKSRNSSSLMIMGVPQPLRQQNLQQLIPDLLSYAALISENDQALPPQALSDWLTNQITQVKSDYTLSEAIQVIAEIEQLWRGNLPLDDRTFVRPVDFSATIAAMKL